MGGLELVDGISGWADGEGCGVDDTKGGAGLGNATGEHDTRLVKVSKSANSNIKLFIIYIRFISNVFLLYVLPRVTLVFHCILNYIYGNLPDGISQRCFGGDNL